MSFRLRISLQHLGLMPVTALVVLSAIGARAEGATTSRSVTTPRISAPARASSISADLLKATGYSASQLTTRAACGSAPTGRFRCYARVLTLKSTGRPATLLHAPHATPTTERQASSGTTAPQEYTAAYLQAAYDTTWLSANRGASDTVAIVDAYGDSTAYSDMEAFRTANGLTQIPTCADASSTSCFEVVNQNGQTTNLPTNASDETDSWNVEESLDIDAVSSICPLCKMIVVEAKSDDDRGSPDLETAVSTAARLGADQISLSWGADVSPDAADYSSPYSSISTAAILAAAGDGSYPGPDVGYPAALPDVTAVGGTSLVASPTSTRGFDESTWSVETCSDGTTCATESGCDTSQAVPSYQASVTTDCDGRAYNDISADADPDTGLEIYDSQSGDEGCGDSSHECIVGGTSLATPLTAALEAVTGISSTTPAWTYSDAPLLNDVVSGSDGTCPSGWNLICTAGPGWDGPTGNGSISGELASGGPGLGGATSSGINGNDVTLTGGLYPNGESTSYSWQYWMDGQPSSSAISTPATTTSGSALQSVSTTLCGALATGTTYDYALTATNASGTETGYQGSFTTSATESDPTTSSPPVITGTAQDGQTLSGTDATWVDAGCDSAPSYAWQESSTGSADSWTTVGTGQSYGLTTTDDGKYVRFTATESNAAGSTTATSAVIGPVVEPVSPPPTGGGNTSTTPTPTTTTATSTSPTASTTSTTSTTPPVTTASGGGAANTTTTNTTTTAQSVAGVTTTTTERFYRCARACTLIDTHGARTYRPVKADYGRYIKVVTTVSRISGNTETDTTTTRWIGPVSARTAGSVAIVDGARVATATLLKGSTGRTLAQVRVHRSGAGQLTLVVRRETSAPTRVWAYIVDSRTVVSGTSARALGQSATMSFALKRGQTIRLVAVST